MILYIIEVEPGMAGNWALQLAAKVLKGSRRRLTGRKDRRRLRQSVGVFIFGRIGETPNTRGHSIVGYLVVTGPLFKLTTTSTDNAVNQLRQQIGSIPECCG